DGKILVAVTLAGSQFARRGHRGLINNRLDRKGFCARAGSGQRRRRGPHIGEYGRKTNPVSRWQPCGSGLEKAAPRPPLWASGRAYWLWFFRTWSQACEILARFSLRQARTVKSPWSMTGRQNFCTSRVQAFCSASVPRPAWAKAAVERVADSRVRATRSLRILFLH